MWALQLVLGSSIWTEHDDEEGQGLAEYGLILALVAAVAVAALTGLGSAVINVLGQVVNSF
jgi:pilus assembly protein Flp/PilA